MQHPLFEKSGRVLSVEEAKCALADWCAQTDAALVANLKERASHTRKFLPWIAGGLGFLTVFGARKGVKGGRSIARLVRFALRTAPFVVGIMRGMKQSRAQGSSGSATT